MMSQNDIYALVTNSNIVTFEDWLESATGYKRNVLRDKRLYGKKIEELRSQLENTKPLNGHKQHIQEEIKKYEEVVTNLGKIINDLEVTLERGVALGNDKEGIFTVNGYGCFQAVYYPRGTVERVYASLESRNREVNIPYV